MAAAEARSREGKTAFARLRLISRQANDAKGRRTRELCRRRAAIEFEPTLQFGHFFMSLDAARQGRGIALVPDIILAHEEGIRGLTVPLTSELDSAGEYYLPIQESRFDDPRVQRFRNWALKEAFAVRGNSPALSLT